MQDLTGRTLGPYQILQPLGQGGMAAVYKAYQPALQRHVAVKVLPAHLAGDAQFSERFAREARAVARLDHPNILPVYDFGQSDGITYIVMKYVEGGTLKDLLDRGPMSLPQSAQLLEQMAAALDYAHAQGVVHRDIKPANVLLARPDWALLSDFGLVQLAESKGQLTRTGVSMGTPEFMAPEQADGSDVDARADIYALGVTLYAMVTGQVPYTGNTPMSVILQHVSAPLPSARTVNPALAPAAEAAIQHSMAKRPADRTQTAGELSRAFGQAIRSPATVIEPVARAAPQATVIEPVVGVAPKRVAPASMVTPSTPAAPSYLSMPADEPPRRRSGLWIGAGIVGVLLCAAVLVGGSLAYGLLGKPGTTSDDPTALAQSASPTAVATDIAEAVSVTQVPPVGSDNIYVEYILDASGSMLQPMDGRTRWDIARELLAARLRAMPPDVNVGLRVYGHRVPYTQEEEACNDIELLVPIQAGAADQIVEVLPGLEALGMTPMSNSLILAAEDFTFEPGRKNSIVLISDGAETCGQAPAEVAQYLRELGIDFTVHVIGLAVDANTAAQLAALADAGGGVYYDAPDAQSLQTALDQTQALAVALPDETAPTATPTPIPEPNAQVASEGHVKTSSTSAGFPANLGIDGDPTTSWFSEGSNVDGSASTFRWTGQQDDLIATIALTSNAQHDEPSFRTGYGFDSVLIQVLDASGAVVFEELADLSGTPDPNVQVRPGVVGRSILLTFRGHESAVCGGFGELQVGAVR